MSKLCRFAILNCEDDEKWQSSSKTVTPLFLIVSSLRQVRQNIHGTINRIVEFYVEAFGEAQDSWEVFSCCEGHWPTVEEAKSFDALFITGSSHSLSNETLSWLSPLSSMIPFYLQDNIRIIAIGFGSQLLAHALEGTVGKNPGPFCARVEEISILPELARFMDGMTSISIIESHGQQVTQLPSGAVQFAHSKSCKNEIWCFNSALAIQGHPEFEPEVLLKDILPSLRREKLLSTLDVIHNGRNARNKKLDNDRVRSLVKSFSRTDSMVSSNHYRSLFPNQVNSSIDKTLIKQIEDLTEEYANRPFSGEVGEFRNPSDQPTRHFLETSIQSLTSQFSSLMLKELKQTMVDYQGLDFGSTMILEYSRTALSRRFEQYKPIKELRCKNLFLNKKANQVLEEVDIIVKSLDKSAQLLEQETSNLKHRMFV